MKLKDFRVGKGKERWVVLEAVGDFIEGLELNYKFIVELGREFELE